MNKRYNTYKRLKNSFHVQYKGYEMKYIMADDFAFLSYDRRKIDLRVNSIKRNLFYSLDFSRFTEIVAQPNSVIFSFSNYGKDHENTLVKSMKGIEGAVRFDKTEKLYKHYSFYNIFCSLIQILFFNFKNVNLSFQEKIYFFLRLVFYKNNIDVLERYSSHIKTKAFVPFLSATFTDSLYCQFFKRKGIKSYGVQHGIHLNENYYKDNIPFDVINIENFQADYMLAWGEFMKDVFRNEGLDENRVLITGNPKYENNNQININISTTKNCIVSLARDEYKLENLNLLHIASQLQKEDYVVHIKVHPRSDLNFYSETIKNFNLKVIEKNTSLSESISLFKPDFVVVYNSTVYYEYLIQNVPAFRYNENEKDIPFGMDDDFGSYDELISRLREYKSEKQNLLNEKINNFINYYFSLGINNYAKILNNAKND